MCYQRAPALRHEVVIIQMHTCQQETLSWLPLPRATKYHNRSTAVVKGKKNSVWLARALMLYE